MTFASSEFHKKVIFQDIELCAALGIYPDSGCCLRHPNITILNPKDDDSAKIIHTCQRCESEYLSDGTMTRNSFAFTVMQLQKLNNDEKGWNRFQQNWEQASNDTNEEETFAANYTYQVILRSNQVKEWSIMEKEKELSRLRSKLQAPLSRESDIVSEDIEYVERLKDSEEDSVANLKMKTEKESSKGFPPVKPIRQASNDLLVSSTHSRWKGRRGDSLRHSNSNRGSNRRIKVQGDKDANQAPTVPSRQASNDHASDGSTRVRRISSGVSGVSELTSSEFDFDEESSHAITESSLSLTAQSISTGTSGLDRSLTLHSLETIESTNTSSGHNSGETKGSEAGKEEKDRSSGDISFDPNEIVPKPSPPLVPVENSLDNSHSKSNSDNHEIRFDASQDIKFMAAEGSSGNVDFRRSVADMKFNAKEQLLFEASQALASPQVVIGRKNKAKVSNTETPKRATEPNKFQSGASKEVFEQRSAAGGNVDKTEIANDLPALESGGVTPSTSSDEETDEFQLVPNDLPTNEAGFLQINVSARSLSPITCVTSLTKDSQKIENQGVLPHLEEIEPRKGLHVHQSKVLPVEESFELDEIESDEESSDARSETHTANGTTYVHVVDQLVNDKYGEAGIFTGSVMKESLVPHGKGVMMYENERMYDGDWEFGRWHGKGIWVNPTGDRYEGDFKFDCREGIGAYFWKSGNVYKGSFKGDKREGKGTFTFANGNVYEGEFLSGMFEGNGKYTFGNGYYEGTWKSGKYHGSGLLRFTDGSSFSGSFDGGVAHGEGIETSEDGLVTTGFWNQGRAPLRLS